jgi:hypothetical protein
MKPTTPAQRKRKERERDKALGLIRRDVKAHPDDWPAINLFALELKLKRKNSFDAARVICTA